MNAPIHMRPPVGVDGLIVDLFAGGGGASEGLFRAVGRDVDIAINHDAVALAVHRRNHPRTRHLEANMYEARPLDVTQGRRVWFLWASPDCTDFSNAKGDVPLRQHIRCLAWTVWRWARTVLPDIIALENVREFEQWGPLGKDKRPIKSRRGEEFKRFVRKLRSIGYVVDWRVLDASQYGAPTRRKRLFLIARRDGRPIVWPDPTHGPGLLPFRTAAECIDWDRPCPSIFLNYEDGRAAGVRRPLAEKTLWRIAQGIRRFVLESAAPFIVKVNHGKREARVTSIDEPLTTITARQRGHAVVAPTLVQTGYGERKGQRPRYLDLHAPIGTLMAKGQKHALVSAFLAKHYGDPLRESGGGRVIGTDVTDPIGTITARDHHTLAAVCLAKFRGSEKQGHPGCADVEEPLPTITAKGNHIGEVRAFLTAYYGNDGTSGQQVFEPMRTITTRHRLGLVTVGGTEYQITDIGMRILVPEELKRAQFGQYAEGYDLSPARTNKDKVRLIGNSVPPELVEAVVASNIRGGEARAA